MSDGSKADNWPQIKAWQRILTEDARESNAVMWILTDAQAQVVYDALGAYVAYCHDRDRDAPHAIIQDLREHLVRMQVGRL